MFESKMETRTFAYTKADGSRSNREVFVVAENDKYVQGLDHSQLSDEQWKEVIALTGKISKTVGKGLKAPAGYKSDWDKAWRLFKKANISDR